ncbi:MAG: hypothetical protein WC294_06030 [Methanoregula sp.]|jgi:hypothetical protein
MTEGWRVGHKVCSSCRKEKELSEFSKYHKGKYGVHNQCKQCKSACYFKTKDDPDKKERRYLASAKYKNRHPYTVKMRLRKTRECLADSYIRQILKQSNGIIHPPQELIEIKRQQISLKRTLREVKDESSSANA